MRRSAMRSSSIVLTPGSHAAFRGGRTDASKLPARAMRSISWAVFRLIIGSSSCALCRLGSPTRRFRADLPCKRGCLDCGHDLAAYLIDCAHAVDLRNQAFAPVMVEHRDRLREVNLDPGSHRLSLVVFALDQLAS